jgi:tetratricopeptide (TPR) repeat protein
VADKAELVSEILWLIGRLGEALSVKKRPDQALVKVEEANKYAPNWGRLHLKWGEALGFAGNKDEAQKQFALAAGLDMSVADKAEFTK